MDDERILRILIQINDIARPGGLISTIGSGAGDRSCLFWRKGQFR